MKSAYDVVVVGAGPAGAVAARRAAEGGLSTLLLEKRPEIGVPVRCAEAIGAEICLPFIQLDPKWIDAEISAFCIYNAAGEGVKVPPAEPTLVVNRKVFDLELVKIAARCGAEVYTSAPAVGIMLDKKQVVGVRVEHLGRTMEISARLVVAADGVEGQVAQWAGLRIQPGLGDFYSGVEFLLGNLKNRIDPATCEYHLNRAYAPGGYLWVFPKGEDTANVGLVFSGDQAPERPAFTLLEEFIARRYPGASVLGVISGGIPITGAVKNMVADGLVLVGDAAHQADPLTAGGINLGMIGADLAMQAGVPAVKAGDVSARQLKSYPDAWRKRFGAMHAAMYRMRKILAGMDPQRLDALVHRAGELDLQNMALGDILLALLKSDPKLLFEARMLITTGLIMK